MNKELAIVTGGGNGIGAKVCQMLIKKDIYVVIVDNDKKCLSNDWLKEAINNKQVDFELLDCRDVVGIESLVKNILSKYSRIDILVNNVGGNTEKRSIENLDDSYLKDTFNQNFYTAINFLRVVTPAMRNRKYGRIVNVTSIAGRTFSYFSNAAYVSSKAALIGLTKQLAFEEARYNISVNSVSPGPIGTDRIKEAWENKSETEKSSIMGLIPSNRFGEVEEAAEAIVYLCSKNAGYCNGVTLDVNGGMFI
ncbi:MAG: SDR family oxidoreductase [Alphaproteobacteria bacterium]|jgi:NAD(P)-dependent dehydrogenase (short-subunit alcohol dehydrogenase family)|nr:SDR family oxidoreductase [Alphaproteobacteria bacterium]